MSSVVELEREIAELAARIDVANHRLLTCIREFYESEEWGRQGAISCAHWLSWRIGLDLVTARERVRVARALGKLPAIDAAMATGKLSYSKVRAISRVATPANEAACLEVALAATAAQLERMCRGYVGALHAEDKPSREARSVRRWTLPSGMVKIEMVLCPDEAEQFFRALDRAREVEYEATKDDGDDDSAAAQSLQGQAFPETAQNEAAHASAEARSREQRHQECAKQNAAAHASAEAPKRAGGHHECEAQARLPSHADGVVALAETYLAGNPVSGNGGERFQVMIHVEQDALAPEGVLAATLEDGTAIPAETLRRVACDSGIVAVTGDAQNGLSIGRRSRSIPPAIRRALLLRDHGCRFPGCTHTHFLHGHHVQHWLHGGETSLDNIVTLCTRHHHMVHEDGWTIERDDDGGWEFVAPTGQAAPYQPHIEVAGDTLTWLRKWADDRGVDLGPDANYPQWDGSPMDYDLTVSGLMAENDRN